jgi:hypothetical protein
VNLPGEGKGWKARKADNLAAIFKPMPRTCGNLDFSQSHGPPRPVTRIALPFKRGAGTDTEGDIRDVL